MCCVLPDVGYAIKAQKSGTNWSSTSYTATLVQDSLKIVANGDYETMTINLKFNGAGQYTLNGNPVYYHNTSTQAAVLTTYMLDNTAVNSFNIISYNTYGNIIEGFLNIALVKTYNSPGVSFPQNLSFLNGYFRLQLVK
jgi:hypothetical protein